MNKAFILGRLHWKDMSQAELARQMGLDRSQVTRLLSGERELKAKEVRPLALLLGVTEKDILDNLEVK